MWLPCSRILSVLGCTTAWSPQEVQGDRVPCNPLLCSSPHLSASTARPGSSHSRSLKYMKLLNFHHWWLDAGNFIPYASCKRWHASAWVLGRGSVPQMMSHPPLWGSPEKQGHVSLHCLLLSLKIMSNFVFIHQRRKLPPRLVQAGLWYQVVLFRRAFTVSKGLREQEVAHSVTHLDLELLDTDLNG